LKSVPKTYLTIGVFIVIVLPVLAITIITLYIVFSDVLSSITRLVKRIANKSKIAIYIWLRYVAIIGTITLIITILIFSSIKDLPDANTVTLIARTVGNDIAGRNMASLSRSMDNIIHAIIHYQEDPDATRNRVYEDALKQAADKGYVFYIPQRDYYITGLNKRNSKRLLTEEERNRIKTSLDDILKRSDKRDQISLMNMVLSDVRVTGELWTPKERLADLSSLGLMGVVGGYIGELMVE
jgi:hypothetical protein